MRKSLFLFAFAFVLVVLLGGAPAGAAGRRPLISVAGPTRVEQSTRLTLDVSIDKAPANKATVRVGTEDATARAGIDYLPVSVTVTFTRRGARHVTVPITILSNPSSSTERTFTVRLTAPSHAEIGAGLVTVGIAPQPSDAATQADVVRALNDETHVYDTNGAFDAITADMKAIDPALDWGGRLSTVVGNSSVGVDDIVCAQETAPSGLTYALAYVVHGASAGVYSSAHACPVVLTEAAISAFGQGWFSDSNVETQAELRRAMFDEFHVLTFHGAYDASVADMTSLDPFLDWGGRLMTVVGDSSVGLNDVVCLQETATSGVTFSIAQIAQGPMTGTYFGKAACPLPTEAAIGALGGSW